MYPVVEFQIIYLFFPRIKFYSSLLLLIIKFYFVFIKSIKNNLKFHYRDVH